MDSNDKAMISCTLDFRLIFIDCSLPSERFPLQVLSASSEYNSTGEFYCANGGSLFDSKGNRLNSNKTVCDATAQWNNQNEFNCFTGIVNVLVTVGSKKCYNHLT